MRVVPVVTRSSILAALLLFPVAAILAAATIEGSLGARLSAVVVTGALLYAVVVWLLSRRRERAELGRVGSAPAEARLEALGRSALSALLVPLILLPTGVLAIALDVFAAPLVVAAGVGLAEARVAARYAGWERRNTGRLVRDPMGNLRVF